MCSIGSVTRRQALGAPTTRATTSVTPAAPVLKAAAAPVHQRQQQQAHPGHIRHAPRAVRAAARRGQQQGSVADGLISVLKDELKVEKERYRTPEEVLEGPPNGFELEDTPNSNSITLARSFKGEDVYVEVDLDEQMAAEDDQDEDDEDEEEEYVATPVLFSVTVSKGDSMIAFKCVGGGDYVRITQVELDDTSDSDQFTPYTGPVFEELDETLQQAFTDYLDERGITPEFGSYLVELVADKLEVEYMNWLQRVRDFLEAKPK